MSSLSTKLPLWVGLCDCGTQSLQIMCLVDHDTHLIEMYDNWVKCSWCGKDWRLDPHE